MDNRTTIFQLSIDGEPERVGAHGNWFPTRESAEAAIPEVIASFAPEELTADRFTVHEIPVCELTRHELTDARNVGAIE